MSGEAAGGSGAGEGGELALPGTVVGSGGELALAEREERRQVGEPL